LAAQRAVKGIPSQFECMSRTWDVKWVAQGTLHDEEGNPSYGITDFVNAIVILEEGHPPRFIRPVFWHEMGHVVHEAMGVPSDEHDEKTMDLFGQIMAQVEMTRLP
jgi:hypothetical protein